MSSLGAVSKAKKLLYDMELAAAAVEQTWHVRGAQKASLFLGLGSPRWVTPL